MELASYFLTVKYLFVLLFASFLLLLYRRPRPWILAWGAVGFSIFTYVASLLPLERPYALRPGGDRSVNLAMAATAATGHSPFESYQVASADHEPWWRLLMGVLSLGEPENVVTLYAVLPAVMMILMALTLYFGLRGETGNDTAAGQRWELALVVYTVLLLSSSPHERFGEVQTFWAMTFLFKPNHALGMVVIPVFIACWTSARPSFRTAGAGFVLGWLAWIFVMHWSYVVLGVLLYPLVARWLARDAEPRRVVSVVALSLLLALPYVVYLYRYYWGIDTRIEGRVWPRPGPMESYFNVFSPGYEHGVLFFLSLAGIVAMIRRRRAVDGILLSLLSSCLVGWMLYVVAFGFGKALQAEEFYFFTRFMLSIAAGSGAYWLVARVPDWLESRVSFRGALTVFLLVMLPHVISYWWNPPATDRYYEVSLEPIPENVAELCRWVREETSRDAVFAADPLTASWIAALTGRRVLLIGPLRPPRDYDRRQTLMEGMVQERRRESFREAAREYSVSHLVYEGDDAELENLSWLDSVYELADVEVFRLRAQEP